TWEPRGELRGNSSLLQSVAFSDDGAYLAAARGGATCVWDIATKTRSHELPHGAHCVAFAHRRPLMATAGGDGLVKLWRIADGGLEATLASGGRLLDCVGFA